MLQLVPTPIGNIADISYRALRSFEEADVLLCEDTRVTKQLLHILQERYNLKFKQNIEFIPLHSHNEKEFIAQLQSSFFDKNVVYVSDAGMPGVSDPGAKLVDFAQKNNIEYDVLPGSNAVLTAYVASGFDAHQFLFYGFLPHKGKERTTALQSALYSGFVTILYEAPHRLLKLLKEMAQLEPQREVFLAKELTKKFQTFYKGIAKELLKELPSQVKGEWVVVIAPSDTQVQQSAITQEDILALDIPKKQKAKLLSKITGESVKEIYNKLL